MKGLKERIRGWLRRLQARWTALRTPGKFLCDTCRYDYGDVCRRPERPNAQVCEDYRPR